VLNVVLHFFTTLNTAPDLGSEARPVPTDMFLESRRN